jgi:hypothetical protein|tara:strand:+ start:277 stop:567 length:291 start_codon:yes stop_codon:yes gene_type:complete
MVIIYQIEIDEMCRCVSNHLTLSHLLNSIEENRTKRSKRSRTKLDFFLSCSIIDVFVSFIHNKLVWMRGMGVENNRWDAAYKLEAFRNPFRVRHAC